ncbi:hypothetical protein R5R35_007395 [Gryllus longicercus]|uniref:CHK kinase-like domain-containing protein n=1 Tax=Gryllus longicercus TaxID=2509291 RepID=A0AAN9VNM3_9ORTH
MADFKKSKDPRAPPSWIDVALIQQALRNSGEENAQVAAISVGCATSKGDNYASTIYRVKVTLTDRGERSLIVKGPEPWQTEESRSFVRETIMLTEVLPQLEAMLEEAFPGSRPRLGPRCHHHGSSPVQFIVMEDLGPQGFRLGDRRRGLGLRHSLLALRGLARYHAASHALLRRQPEATRQLDNLWLSMAPPVTRFVHSGLQATADACRGWPGCEQLAPRLERFKDVAMETFTKLNEPKPGAFNVLVHGDFWINNLMFRYEDGEVADFLPVDFQFPHEASPAIDLLYFLGGSVSDNVHAHHQDLLLREYHGELRRTLQLLGCQAPSLEALLSAVEAHGAFSLFMATCGVANLRTGGGADIPAMYRGEHARLAPLFEVPGVAAWLRRVLPDYARRGWLPA